jgi:hypothetical protein
VLKRSRKIRSSVDANRKKPTKERVKTGINILSSSTLTSDYNNIEWYKIVLDKFPTFDPSWPDDVKSKWFEAFNTLLKKGEATFGIEKK